VLAAIVLASLGLRWRFKISEPLLIVIAGLVGLVLSPLVRSVLFSLATPDLNLHPLRGYPAGRRQEQDLSVLLSVLSSPRYER